MVRTTDVEYEVDGRPHVGFLAVDTTTDETRPGILLCHEGGGLQDNVRERASRLAEAGYVAFGLDYYGAPLPSLEELMAQCAELKLDAMRTRALARAGLDVLKAQPETDVSRLAAIGFCFGGTMAIELARDGADLRAVVGFHCHLTSPRPEDSVNISAPVLVCAGADDPLVPREMRIAWEDEMTAAGVDWRLHLYGGTTHSFTARAAATANDPLVHRYSEATDRRSWSAMIDLFDEVFTPAD